MQNLSPQAGQGKMNIAVEKLYKEHREINLGSFSSQLNTSTTFFRLYFQVPYGFCKCLNIKYVKKN